MSLAGNPPSIQNIQATNEELQRNHQHIVSRLLSTRSIDITAITTQLEQTLAQNSKLTAELRRTISERDDAARRLEIHIQRAQDSHEVATKQDDQRTQLEMTRLQASFAQQREEFERRCAQHHIDMTLTSNHAEKCQTALVELEQSVAALLQAAKSRFSTDFPRLKNLTNFLRRGDPSIEKVKKLRRRLRNETRVREAAEAKIYELHATVKSQRADFETRTAEWRQQTAKLEHEIATIEEQHKTECALKESEQKSLLAKTRELEAEIQVLKTNAEDLSMLKPQNAELTTKLSQLEASNQEIPALSAQVRAGDAKNRQLSTELERTKDELRATQDKLRAVEVERDTLKSTVESMSTQLKADESSFLQSKSAFAELQCHVSSSEAALQATERAMSKQRKELRSLIRERGHLVDAIRSLGQLADYEPEPRKEVVQTVEYRADPSVVASNQQLRSELSELRESVDGLMAQLSAIVPGEKPDGLVAKLGALRDRSIEHEITNKTLKEHLDEIFRKLNAASFVDALKALERLLGELHESEAKLANEKAKHQKLVHQMKVAKKRKEKVHRNYHMKVVALESDKSQLRASLNDAKHQISYLKCEIEEAKTLSQTAIPTLGESHDEELTSLADEFQSFKKEAEAKLAGRDEELATRDEELAHHKHEAAQAKQAVASLTEILAEKDEQIQLLKLENEGKLKRVRSQIEDVPRQYQEAAGQLRTRNRELQDLVSNYSSALDEAQSRNKFLATSLSQVEAQKSELSSKVVSCRRERSRDRKLAEAKLTAMEMFCTTQRQIDMQRIKADHEEDQRKLFAFVAAALSQFVDLRKELTTDAFREMVNRIAAELRRHQQQEAEIRNMLGISSLESCTDALARLLHGKCRPFN
jgi:chromosome segregation ATPase